MIAPNIDEIVTPADVNLFWWAVVLVAISMNDSEERSESACGGWGRAITPPTRSLVRLRRTRGDIAGGAQVTSVIFIWKWY